ncbi:hypothetical protein PVK64_19230 [Aliivibrio sp. S4TY2]|uniref:hypothetical protein n=1 Tax=unclassified Aliivibrio TaxID=2645654 RepID=UPI0023797AFC|nr:MULTISPECIES: hypothetical protein [unclassified Aliivibrio]MDD9158300.1 hypothetical protein [Aliivibrio sp. S4TY2]MDD9162270.1 hypothetical protein [Aliivibrio sp. S4TY1]MDD9166308.1 hypothetical protein [Aliivibrio sp. S4MY2]MDD9170306.1 hypothetical protein [Aliivibrio sp. S4MY4]MDD9187357.1 hypothetical protein [Aliivibrio sp. S4MY3]
MHFLQNGSQVSPVPAPKPRTGTPGYFTESGVDNRPSYPGQDWFNAVIREFQGALSANGVAFDPEKYDHLTKLLAGNGSQFAPYRADREYATGETCTTINATTAALEIWQMYAGPNLSCINKNPQDPLNRHDQWSDDTSPFWWIPYVGSQVGMPFYWLSVDAPEWAIMEINVNLPTAVYWRLALRYPLLVSGGYINTGEIRGEYLRVLDQGRGVDVGRQINSWQDGQVGEHNHDSTFPTSTVPGGGGKVASGANSLGTQLTIPTTYFGGDDSLVRNIARPMAIII